MIWLLGAATYSLAAGSGVPSATNTPSVASAGPKFLQVPDVRKQTYVFAEGILQDAGFAWRVGGGVKGFAANLVALQDPAPGTRVVDNGAPTVVLRLEHNPQYSERGLPQNASPYDGTSIVLPGELPKKAKKAAKPKKAAKNAANHTRKPDFTVAGAPREPADEMPLPDRARLLEHRLDAAPRPNRRLVRYWLFQHSWIVTGARFGWSQGAEALKILIRVDERLHERWGFGVRSEAVARRALAYVERRDRAK